MIKILFPCTYAEYEEWHIKHGTSPDDLRNVISGIIREDTLAFYGWRTMITYSTHKQAMKGLDK